MNSHTPTLDRDPRIVPESITVIAVLVGDALVLFAFIGVGLLSHTLEPWRVPVYTLRTLAPFLIAWLVVAPIVGASRRETLTGYGRTVGVVSLAWIGAAVLGAAIRSTSSRRNPALESCRRERSRSGTGIRGAPAQSEESVFENSRSDKRK